MTHYAKQKGLVSRAVSVVCGAVAGSILTVAMPAVEMEFGDIEIPESDEATYTLPFRALGSGSGANEITLTFT